MSKSVSAFLLGAFTVFAFPAAHLLAAVIPPIGLAPGSQYQLIFVTANAHNALSFDIGDYNMFVSDEAALSPGLPSGATWNAVASTDAMNANANATSGALPVYNTAGQEVSAAGVGIYSGALDSLVGYDQFGEVATEAQANNVWTGSDYTGTAIAGATLGGAGSAEVGQLALDATWLQFTTEVKVAEVAFSRPFYALSTPITSPTPEPATVVPALMGFVALVAWRWRSLRPAYVAAG